MPKSTAFANLIVDHLLGGPAFPSPTGVWAALFTVAPTAAGGGTEVTGAGYERAVVDVGPAMWPAAVGGTKSNAVRIGFPTAGASWGSVVAYGLFTAASGGTMLYFALLPAPITISTSDQPGFEPGTMTISEA